MYLLDTNHCSRLLQGDSGITERLKALDAAPVATSAIVHGELMFMVHRSDRRAENLAAVQSLLADLIVLPVDDTVAAIYGQTKAALLDRFGPRERARRRRYDLRQLGISDNDLWIAATAQQHAAIVVSADEDFARMAEVIPLRIETWWQPGESRLR